jgi:hypothetical protein
VSELLRIEKRKQEKHGRRWAIVRSGGTYAYDFVNISRGNIVGTLTPVRHKPPHVRIGHQEWLFSRLGNGRYPNISIKRPDSDEEVARYLQLSESEGTIRLGETEEYEYDRTGGRAEVLWRTVNDCNESGVTATARLDRKAKKLAARKSILISYRTSGFLQVTREIEVADLATVEPHIRNYELLIALGVLLNLRYDSMELRDDMRELAP